MVKFLYLCECEYFRRYRRRLTPLRWFFYKYGPWARELAKRDQQFVEREDKIVSADKCIKYYKLDWLTAKLPGEYLEDIAARAVVRQVVRQWAKRYTEDEAKWELVTRELLNEVYHHTAPMRHAKRGEMLDFSLIPPAKPTIEVKLDRQRIAEVKKRFHSLKKNKSTTQSLYPLPELAPNVREKIATALERLEQEEYNWLTGDFSVKIDKEDGTFGVE